MESETKRSRTDEIIKAAFFAIVVLACLKVLFGDQVIQYFGYAWIGLILLWVLSATAYYTYIEKRKAKRDPSRPRPFSWLL